MGLLVTLFSDSGMELSTFLRIPTSYSRDLTWVLLILMGILLGACEDDDLVMTVCDVSLGNGCPCPQLVWVLQASTFLLSSCTGSSSQSLTLYLFVENRYQFLGSLNSGGHMSSCLTLASQSSLHWPFLPPKIFNCRVTAPSVNSPMICLLTRNSSLSCTLNIFVIFCLYDKLLPVW